METTTFNSLDNKPADQAKQLDTYWQQYGLNQSPFEDNSQYAMYYPRPEWQAYLEELRDFCDSPIPLQIIQGELGSGKSILIAQLLAQIDQDTYVCQIKGQDGINVPQLIKEISKAFTITDQQDHLFIDEQIHALCQALMQLRKGNYLIVVDDADLLPIETLTTLMQLALTQDYQRIHLHVLLTSELRLENQLQHLAQEMHGELSIPIIELTPLNLEETKNYLRYRLSRAGLKDKMLFNKEMINNIYHLSGGIPGRINRVAQQILMDNLRPDNERLTQMTAERRSVEATSTGFFRQHSVKILSGILLIAVAGAVWQFNRRPNIADSAMRAHSTNAEQTSAPQQRETAIPLQAEQTVTDTTAPTTPTAANNTSVATANTVAPNAPASENPAATVNANTGNATSAAATPTANASTSTNATAAIATAIAPTSATINTPAANSANEITSAPDSANSVSAAAATASATPTAPVASPSAASAPQMPPANAQPLSLPPQPAPPANVQALNSTALRQPIPPTATPAEDKTPAESAAKATAHAIAAAVAPTAESANAAATPQPVPPLKAQSQAVPAPATDASNTTASTTVTAQNTIEPSAAATAVEATTAAPAAINTKPAASATASHYTAAEKQLLAMQGYTLQVIGSRSTRDLQMVKNHDKSGQNRYLAFRTQFLGKPWHVLVYGNYPDRARAQAAAKKLSARMPGVHPWVRPLSSVHEAIKNG